MVSGFRLKITLPFFLFLCGLVSHAQNSLLFNKVTTNQGLSHNTIYAIEQDPYGFMWFGTREGLNRYDGENIETYYHIVGDTNTVVGNQITALKAIDKNNLYIGTTEGVSVYNPQQHKFSQLYFQGKSIGSVNQLFVGSDSTVFICSNNGLYVKRPNATALFYLMDNLNVLDIFEYKKGVYWVATFQKLFMINAYGEVIKEFDKLISNNREISLSFNISCFYQDSKGKVWLGSKQDGVFQYDEKNDVFRPVLTDHKFNALEVNIIRALCEGPNGNLWIGTESGLFIYNPEDKSFQHYSQTFDQSPTSLNDKAIYEIHRSKEDIMWLGTYFGGVNLVKPDKRSFKSILADGGEHYLSGKAVSDMIQDASGRIWIGTEDGGVNVWDKQNNTFKYWRNQPNGRGLSVDNVHALYQSDEKHVWIGTFLGGLNEIDLKIGRVEVYKNAMKAASFTNNMVYAIHGSVNNSLLIGTQAGLSTFDMERNTYQPLFPQYFRGKFIYELFEETSGKIWACLMNSDSLYRFDPRQNQIEGFKYTQTSEESSRLGQGIISAHQSADGTMWFGTVNSGLLQFNEEDGTFTQFTIKEGLPNNYVYGILEDDHHNLWLSTNKGLSSYDYEQDVFRNYDISHGLPNNQFNFKSALKDADGWMYFGTINGLCYFHPDSIVVNERPPKTYLSDLKLFNKSVSVGDDDILENSITATEKINLEHDENVITIEYAGINYFSKGSNRYAYYLEGFEDGWNFVGNKKSATYTNLSSGSYTFKLKAANNDNVWSDDIRTLTIVIAPPFWATKWAFGLYALAILGLFMLYRGFLNYRNREKMAVQIERIEKDKIKEINQHKLNFFTYISHEFKTPLTLIMAAIDRVMQDEAINGDNTYQKGFWSIKRNVKRLHFLIDQLMEFRKVETDHAKINFVKGDIVLFLEDTFKAFTPLFGKKEINHTFTSNRASFVCFFDNDKVEKIITNILSNAAKYTIEGGSIDVQVTIFMEQDVKTPSMEIVVADTGKGIDSSEIEEIFTSYYQTEHGRKSGQGTGIGLALVKSLVEFLKGSISISSNELSGTAITINLPLQTKIQESEHVAVIEGNQKVEVAHELYLSHHESKGLKKGYATEQIKNTLMIVEDNEEINDFLYEHFQDQFKVVRVKNGRAAVEKMDKYVPDVILSDVMMPEMDGIELCKALKHNIKTSHIPIILLTAKTSIENKLEGLDVGADAYVTKPFSVKELELRIKNLLTSRNSLRKHFQQFGNIEGAELTLNNKDEDLLLKLTKIVKDNLDDSSFNITRFTKEAGVSRTLLHLKLKKLVDLSASEFIKTIRLKKACDLLTQTDLSISQVAYKVGFAEANYFSRSFKEKFEQNPSEYRQTQQNL